MDVSPGPMTPSKLKNLLSRPALPAYGYHSDRKIGIKIEGRKDAGDVSDPIMTLKAFVVMNKIRVD